MCDTDVCTRLSDKGAKGVLEACRVDQIIRKEKVDK